MWACNTGMMEMRNCRGSVREAAVAQRHEAEAAASAAKRRVDVWWWGGWRGIASLEFAFGDGFNDKTPAG